MKVENKKYLKEIMYVFNACMLGASIALFITMLIAVAAVLGKL